MKKIIIASTEALFRLTTKKMINSNLKMDVEYTGDEVSRLESYFSRAGCLAIVYDDGRDLFLVTVLDLCHKYEIPVIVATPSVSADRHLGLKLRWPCVKEVVMLPFEASHYSLVKKHVNVMPTL